MECRVYGASIFKRLDRFLINQEFLGAFGKMMMEHLARTGSNFSPLLLSCGNLKSFFNEHINFFKFWVKVDDFNKVL